MIPDEIIQLFRNKWSGTAAELAEALEAFYLNLADAIVSGMDTEGVEPSIAQNVTDLVEEHYRDYYLEDNIPE